MTNDPNSPQRPPGSTPPASAPGTSPGTPISGIGAPGRPGRPGRPARPVLSAAEKRQRNLTIALSVGAVLVLIAGMIAFVATRNGRDSSGPTGVVPTSSSSIPEQQASSTTDVATTSTDVTTTAPTTVPIPANADAGDDIAVDQAVEFKLVAANLDAGTPSAAVRWTQTAGPDVTAGVGSLRGAEAVAIAPAFVATLTFRLEVAGTDGVATDDVIVRVLEDADKALFVDGERGDDSAIGSISAPVRSLGFAVQAASGRDIYLRSVGEYDTSAATLELANGVSLYGGFDENWMRDTNQRTVIRGASIAISATGAATRSLSAIEVTAGDAEPGQDSSGVIVQGAGSIRVLDSRVVGGAAGAGVDGAAGGRSFGMFVSVATDVRIERSTLNAGRGGRGSDGVAADAASGSAGPAESGGNGLERSAGQGGGSGSRAGGKGGDGGSTGAGSTAPGGGAGGTTALPNGRPGSGGNGGAGGVGGKGGVGVLNAEDGATAPVGRSGVIGNEAANGAGGAGGGGGNGPALVDGGGGAGAGAGGAPSVGAAPGAGGGGSIGLWIVDVDRLIIAESLIAGGSAGNGGDGAAALPGQVGGPGGRGAAGVDGVVADGGNGGGGGGGGAGGTGGMGGGGAGGPSIGLLTADVSTVEISATTVRGGGGGNGAAGGAGGAPGLGGDDGDGRSGGAGGSPASGVFAEAGTGASGGSSYGWFDDGAAAQVFDDAQLLEGAAGNGGSGSTRGADGVQAAKNT